jgi:hypothetical protein
MNPNRRAASLLAAFLCAFAVPAYAASCLLFPLSCLKPKKKYGEEMEALVLDLSGKQTDYYHVTADSTYVGPGLDTTRQYYIWFKVGETLYQAQRDETILQMGYKPKRDEWVGKTVKLRFRDQKWMGMKSSWVVFERGKKGKEWEFVLVSIIGPDGVDECSKWKLCPYQAEVDREAREQEQLARLAQSGQKSATDVAPMPATPETPDVAAPTTAVAATPDAGAPPAEQPALTPEMAPAESGGPVEGVEPGAEPATEPPTGQEAPVVVAGTEPPTTS